MSWRESYKHQSAATKRLLENIPKEIDEIKRQLQERLLQNAKHSEVIHPRRRHSDR